MGEPTFHTEKTACYQLQQQTEVHVYSRKLHKKYSIWAIYSAQNQVISHYIIRLLSDPWEWTGSLRDCNKCTSYLAGPLYTDKLCLSSEVLRPNTKWWSFGPSLISHFPHFTALSTTRSKKKELVHCLELCKWIRALLSLSESSPLGYFLLVICCYCNLFSDPYPNCW